MGTLSMSLTGVGTDALPGIYPEIRFAQGEVSGNVSSPKVLFIVPKTTGGSATAGTVVYPIGSIDDAETLGGTGGPLRRMYKRFQAVCPNGNVFAVFPAESGGTAASDTVTFAGATIANGGSIEYTILGDTIVVPFATGEAYDTVIAERFKTYLNLRTDLPVTAARGTAGTSGVVTVTYRVKGTDGNAVRHRVRVVQTATSGLTVACGVAALAGGLTDETYTTSLATIIASDYDLIVPGINPTGVADIRLGLCAAQVIAQALPSVNIREQLIYGYGGTPANAVTVMAGVVNTVGCANYPRCQCIAQENSEWEPREIAAHWAAVRYTYEFASTKPWYNYNGYGVRNSQEIWQVPAPYAGGDYPTSAEQKSMIAGGVTPIAVAANGRTYVVKSVTGSTDIRVRDTNKVTVSDWFVDAVTTKYAAKWSSASLQDDPVNANDEVKDPNSLTPNRLKNLTIKPVYLLGVEMGILETAKTTTAVTGDMYACATGIDPVVTTRINARCPLHVIPCADVFGLLVTENSAA